MHHVDIRPEIRERALRKRGRLHWFDRLDPRATAHLIIDMQNVFVAEGAPIEVPKARDIVGTINRTNAGLRALGVPIIWVVHSNQNRNGMTDWGIYYQSQHRPEEAATRIACFQPGNSGSDIYPALVREDSDFVIVKNRYSAFIAGSSSVERLLRSNGIENVLISGTKTNVCCETTARDAMMLDFRVTMLSDCNATDTDDEHRATLENMVLQFGSVMTGAEIVTFLSRSQ